MRTVTAYLLEYTLENHFSNNKSELARKLEIRRGDFHRIYERCIKGEGNSLTTIEALLKLYFKEGYSLDEAMQGYTKEGGEIAPLKTARQECEDKPRSMREQLGNESKAAGRRAQVLRSAEQFMAQLQRVFCDEACAQQGQCSAFCPCQRFCDFVEWMKEQMDQTEDCRSEDEDALMKQQ